MASAAKTITGILLFAKTESVSGEGAAVTGSTDAIRLAADRPAFNVQYTYDGARGQGNYTGGNVLRGPVQGRNTAGTVKIEGKGSGSAYSSTVVPPSLHPFILASGFSGSFASSKWTYKPTPLGTDLTTIAMAVYTRGEVWPISGALANMTITADNPGPAIFEFALQGILAQPADLASPPARKWFAEDILAPNNTNISLAIGSFTPVVRSWKYEHGLAINPRTNLNATDAHSGFQGGKREPKLTVTIEHPALSSYNPYSQIETAATQSVSLTVGSTQYNRFGITMSRAQIESFTLNADNDVATAEVVFAPAVSDNSSNDDVVLEFS